MLYGVPFTLTCEDYFMFVVRYWIGSANLHLLNISLKKTKQFTHQNKIPTDLTEK